MSKVNARNEEKTQKLVAKILKKGFPKAIHFQFT